MAAVQGDGGGPVEVLKAAGLLETGALQAHLDAPVGPSVDLVAEDDFQEGCIVQLFTAGQGAFVRDGVPLSGLKLRQDCLNDCGADGGG